MREEYHCIPDRYGAEPPLYGSLHYQEELALIKPEQPNRSLWLPPRFFIDEGIAISWQNGKPKRGMNMRSRMLGRFYGE